MEVEIDIKNLKIRDNKRGHKESETTEKIEEVDQLRRSGRKKIKPVECTEKRRVITRPRKLSLNSTMKEIESYYCDKKVKLSSPALETIFEEPKKEMLMGLRKLRRSINFSDVANEKPDKNKVKKRSMKAKKLKTFKKIGKKIGLEFLVNKLKDLDKDALNLFIIEMKNVTHKESAKKIH